MRGECIDCIHKRVKGTKNCFLFSKSSNRFQLGRWAQNISPIWSKWTTSNFHHSKRNHPFERAYWKCVIDDVWCHHYHNINVFIRLNMVMDMKLFRISWFQNFLVGFFLSTRRFLLMYCMDMMNVRHQISSNFYSCIILILQI